MTGFRYLSGAVACATLAAMQLGCQLSPEARQLLGMPVAGLGQGGGQISRVATPGTVAAEGNLTVRAVEPYRIQALGDVIEKVRFTISGQHLAEAKTTDVPKSEFGDGHVSVRWTKVLPGDVTVAAQVFDKEDRVLADASASARVEAGRDTEVELTLAPRVQDVAIRFELGTPLPSPSFFVGNPGGTN